MDKFDMDISKDELFDAMMTLRCGRTPGCDGITIEFYAKFWKLLVSLLDENYKQCLINSHFNVSGRRGIISLIPKKGKDLLWVKNWRPIT